MKKLFILPLLSILLFNSCSDDSSDSSSEENNDEVSEIVGRWRLDYYTPYDEDGMTISIEDCEKESIYIYNEDGTGSYEYVLTIDDGSCAVDGSGTFTYSTDGNSLSSEGETTTFLVEDNTLTITYDDETIDRYIKTTDPLFSEL